jgi:hypothetical protein
MSGTDSTAATHGILLCCCACTIARSVGPIRSSDLRACPLDRWARLAAKAIIHTAEHDYPKPGRTTLRDRHDEALARQVSFHSLSDSMAKAVARPAPGKPRKIERRDLEAAAERYRAEIARAAFGGGHARPAEHVAESLHISRATAGRWIKRARAEGLLGAATGTRAGEAPVRAGVSPLSEN